MKQEKIVSGKEISFKIQKKLKAKFNLLQEKGERVSLGVFIVGEDPVIESFVKIKRRFAELVGIDFLEFRYSSYISQETFIDEIKRKQKGLSGVIVQLPLPKHWESREILQTIDVQKDIDVLHPENIQKFKAGSLGKVMPPVAGAVRTIIEECSFDLEGKKIVVVGRGKLTGEPVGDWLKNTGLREEEDFNFLDLSVSKQERRMMLAQADLIVSGAGEPEIIQKEDIKEGVFLIDMGTSSVNKTLVGDISLDCLEKASFFSKTPGGVGPLTVATVFENVWGMFSLNES